MPFSVKMSLRSSAFFSCLPSFAKLCLKKCKSKILTDIYFIFQIILSSSFSQLNACFESYQKNDKPPQPGGKRKAEFEGGRRVPKEKKVAPAKVSKQVKDAEKMVNKQTEKVSYLNCFEYEQGRKQDFKKGVAFLNVAVY